MSKGNQRCGNCRFYMETGGSRPSNIDPGRCRRHPPQKLEIGETAIWPDVGPDHWCGEWQAEIPTGRDEALVAMARQVLAGDMTAARVLADRIMELPMVEGT